MGTGSFEPALANLPRERTMLLPALLLAEQSHGCVSNEAIRQIASHLRLTVNEIEGVATSYPDLHRGECADRIVRVCTGLACSCAGADAVAARLRELTRHPGAGPSIAVEEAECLFLCGVAPAVAVDGRGFGRMSAADVDALIAHVPEEPA